MATSIILFIAHSVGISSASTQIFTSKAYKPRIGSFNYSTFHCPRLSTTPIPQNQWSQQNQKLKQELAESETLFIASNKELRGAIDWLKEAEEKEKNQAVELKNSKNELDVLKNTVQTLTEELQNTKNATDKLENDMN